MDALGVPADYLAGTLRLSLGYETTAADIDHAIDVVPVAVQALREAGLEAVR
jgi:cysteine sulfinate desulfinase/cysteine desulfurase-like protein